MKNCYVCGCELTKANQSLEHIILNSIGGKLKSKKLLCKTCNSKFGGNIDDKLAKQLNVFANLLNIKRENGNPQSIKVLDEETNEEYIIEPGGKPARSKPLVKITNDGNEVKINVTARNIIESKRILKQLNKKYNQINVDDWLKNAEVKSNPISNITLHACFGGKESFRSICKTAVDYYLCTGGIQKFINHLIPYIDGEIDLNVVNFYYSKNNTPKFKKITHSIIVKGDKKNKILYSYIEFFNVCKFIVLLNGNYTGKSFIQKYCYDVIKTKEIKDNKELDLGLDEITSSLNNNDLPYHRIEEEFGKFLEFWTEKTTKEKTDEIVINAVEEMQTKFANEKFITEEMISFLSDKVAREFVKLVCKRNEHQSSFTDKKPSP
ncbi:HNH endonuclease [Clostridium ljungdahlii]|uniref:HNH endonuclease 5 domain-containing protein n=1 Tax=Clostridium ljungdahlii TaxID=1538 RepID=A0A162KVM0_9CLOT|nr:HNH endonuclease [Clostridium ljungdahlii]OAA84686.1 hypothetical protein WY13_02585 [Clostridium ljungdahlii]